VRSKDRPAGVSQYWLTHLSVKTGNSTIIIIIVTEKMYDLGSGFRLNLCRQSTKIISSNLPPRYNKWAKMIFCATFGRSTFRSILCDNFSIGQQNNKTPIPYEAVMVLKLYFIKKLLLLTIAYIPIKSAQNEFQVTKVCCNLFFKFNVLFLKVYVCLRVFVCLPVASSFIVLCFLFFLCLFLCLMCIV